jgi:hypothetical protein
VSAGHIRQRGESSWQIKYEAGPRDPQTGERRTRTTTVRGTKRDAQRELRRLLGAVDTGQHVDPSKLTLAGLVAIASSCGSRAAGTAFERPSGVEPSPSTRSAASVTSRSRPFGRPTSRRGTPACSPAGSPRARSETRIGSWCSASMRRCSTA